MNVTNSTNGINVALFNNDMFSLEQYVKGALNYVLFLKV